jgi:HSP20 family molecular chaperone IbpA
VLDVVASACAFGWQTPDLFILKGRCLLKLSEFDRAFEAFTAADKIASDTVTRLWLMKCCARRDANAEPLVFEPKPTPERRHDWYQSGTHIVLTIFAPGVSPEQLRVLFEPTMVEVQILQKEPAILKFRIEKPIIPEQSKFVVTPQKIELKMAKGMIGVKSQVHQE